MSMDFHKMGRWMIDMKYKWKILVAIHTIEELHGPCPNVRMKVEVIKINQRFFLQRTFSHFVILGEPYIMATCMETKVLDNSSTYAWVKSQDGRHSVQFLTVRPNHERNRETLGGESRGDF